MSYQTFKDHWLPVGAIDYDASYGYQCVDPIKQYLDQEFGIKAGTWGDAITYWTNTNSKILEQFDRIPYTAGSKAQPGDILVFSSAYSYVNTAGKRVYPGHIAIADSETQMLEQNGAGGNGKAKDGDQLRINTIPYNKLQGYLRPKRGVSDMYTKEQAAEIVYGQAIQAHMAEKNITQQWVDYHAKNLMADPMYVEALRKSLTAGQEWQDANWRYVHYDKDVATLKAQIATGSTSALDADVVQLGQLIQKIAKK